MTNDWRKLKGLPCPFIELSTIAQCEKRVTPGDRKACAVTRAGIDTFSLLAGRSRLRFAIRNSLAVRLCTCTSGRVLIRRRAPPTASLTTTTSVEPQRGKLSPCGFLAKDASATSETLRRLIHIHWSSDSRWLLFARPVDTFALPLPATPFSLRLFLLSLAPSLPVMTLSMAKRVVVDDWFSLEPLTTSWG